MDQKVLLGLNNSAIYSRRKTRILDVGDTPMGGGNPIRVQSMTTVDTMNTKELVEQCVRLIKTGCEYIRITTPSIKEAKHLGVIKNELNIQGYTIPLIADIHFTPNAAECAARIVEKIRINPGNYADRKRFEQIEYTEAAYQQEMERIRNKFIPLIRICKEHGTAMRIGTNHGSLSDRIMSRYGDTPLGMVESALEFVRIGEDQHYYNIALSMKASNTKIMIQAYRLLVEKLDEESLQPYPLHLGVTEAGDGVDGRIKSAVGIGTLLEEGVGDTIRVSLTEKPEEEIPIAKILINRYKHSSILALKKPSVNVATISSLNYNRLLTRKTSNFGGHQVPCVMADFSKKKEITTASLLDIGYRYVESLDKWHTSETASDYLYAGDCSINFALPETLGVIYNYSTWHKQKDITKNYLLITPSMYLKDVEKSDELNFIIISPKDLSKKFVESVKLDPTVILCACFNRAHILAERQRLFATLQHMGCNTPVLIWGTYEGITWEEMQLYAATDIGGLFADGLGNGISITTVNCGTVRQVNEMAFKILQASRVRMSKAEYIACPSCGRTLFPLQEITAKIRTRTSHLKGIKIAIMGCIVNGPGEMSDADYGYVGSGKGKITLYRGKEVVKRHVASDEAVEELINLIREDGKWVDIQPVDSAISDVY